MKIEIETDDLDEAEDSARVIHRPIEFKSRGQKTKLFVLVAMLMLVFIGMNEARKPENWSWMGFDNQVPQSKGSNQTEDPSQGIKPQEGLIKVRESQYESDDDVSDLELPGSGPVPLKPVELFGSGNVLTRQIDSESDPATVAYRPEFWKLAYRQMNITECRLLFRLMRNIRNSQENGSVSAESRGKLVEKLDTLVGLHSTELLNKIALLSRQSPERAELDAQLQGFQSQWQSLALALKADELPTETQVSDIRALQRVMDIAALNDVEDHSRSGRPGDDPAWLRIWETLLDPDVAPRQFQAVTPFQLRAQPKSYRGKPVSVTGELRRIEVIPTRNNPLGINPFYSVWIKHEQSTIYPFNACITDLPEGIELDESKMHTDFKNRDVQIRGVFFKVRTYADSGNTISQTPILLAKSIELKGKTEVASLPVRSKFQISQMQWILFLICMPIIAGSLAYFAYRGTLNRRKGPSGSAAQRIDDTLGELSDDPTIQTVEENLAKLKRDETQ